MNVKFSFFLTLFFIFTLSASAQSILDSNLRNVSVDNLTEQQIQKLYNEAQQRSLTINEITQLATQRGLPRDEAIKLRNRLNQVRSSASNNEDSRRDGRLRYTQPDTARASFFDDFFGADSTRDSLRFYQDIEFLKYQTRQDSVSLAKRKLKDKIFGFSLFTNKTTPFEPSLNIPTPKNYQLGAGDELLIDIYGSQEQTYQLEISPDGSVFIEGIGPIYLNGLTIEQATNKLRNELDENYTGLDNPNDNSISMQVTLGQIRSINVSLVGEVTKPGTYTLPSLATVFNALYSAGGPTVTGSFRDIDIIRGDSVAYTFDLYNLLINGNQSGNIRLNDQDIIKINPYVNRIEIEGEVKRPGIYETQNSETLANLLTYAGRFTGNAYTDRIKIVGSTSRERRINDIGKEGFDDFVLRNGDLVTVQKVLDRFKNIVEIRGAVFREGKYEVTDSTTVYSLINRADGLRGDAFQNRGLIYREQEDYTLRTIPFNVRDIMSAPKENDIALKENDLVLISSIFDLRDDYFVEIQGPVQNPDKYTFAENMTLEDIILKADGFTVEATPYRIEIARRVNNTEGNFESSQIAEIYRFNVDEDLSLNPEDADFKLQPFDKVYVRKALKYEIQQDVVITGQVKYPGSYSLKTKNDRISDIIERAGGLTQDAYTDGATLYRELPGLESQNNLDEDDIEGFFTQNRDSLQNIQQQQSEEVTISKLGIDLPLILKNPGSKYDLLVQKQDSIFIPRQLQTVIVKGGVFYPTSVRYDDDLTYRDYISAAGGFNELAKDNDSYVIYANGDVNRVKRFLFFKNYPEVKPGATLVIPERDTVPGLSPQERIAIYSAIVSTLAVISTTIFQITR